MKIKKRLDVAVQELYPQLTRNQIQSFIMQGFVKVNDAVVTKSGAQVKPDDVIVVSHEQPKYVCRAGWKLEKALDVFSIDPAEKVILDAGLSTGGFTDCLLQRGASKVFGVDVGHGQVHEKISQDPRVQVMERTNLRHLESVGELVDLVTLDLSFISVLKVMPAVSNLIKPGGELVVLIKPQFEAERHEVSRGGIVKEEAIHKRVVAAVIDGIVSFGFIHQGTTESPIEGTMGNKEFLAYFLKAHKSV